MSSFCASEYRKQHRFLILFGLQFFCEPENMNPEEQNNQLVVPHSGNVVQHVNLETDILTVGESIMRNKLHVYEDGLKSRLGFMTAVSLLLSNIGALTSTMLTIDYTNRAHIFLCLFWGFATGGSFSVLLLLLYLRRRYKGVNIDELIDSLKPINRTAVQQNPSRPSTS